MLTYYEWLSNTGAVRAPEMFIAIDKDNDKYMLRRKENQEKQINKLCLNKLNVKKS